MLAVMMIVDLDDTEQGALRLSGKKNAFSQATP